MSARTAVDPAPAAPAAPGSPGVPTAAPTARPAGGGPRRAARSAAPPPVRRAGRRRRRRAPTAVVDAVVLGLAVLLAQLPLLPVFGPAAVLPAAGGGAAIGAALAAVAARRGWGGSVTMAAVLGGYLLAGPVVAAPTLAWSGVLPSPESTQALLRGVVTVWKEVLTLDPQLGASRAVLVAPWLLGLGAAAAAVSIAARTGRAGAWAGLVPPGVLALAVLLGTKTTVLPVAAGIALALLLLPWASWRRGDLAPRRVVALALVGAAVVAGGWAGPLVVDARDRLVLRDELEPPFDPREQPSPLAGFRSFVKQWRDADLLTVRGLPEGARVRLATLDAFDGVVWNVAGSEQSQGSGSFRRVGETLASPVVGERTTVEIEVHHLPMVWLPTVGWAERFDFAGPDAVAMADRLRYNDATGAAVLTDGIPDGARWTVQAVVPPPPAADELADAALGSVRLPAPAGVPDAVPLYAGELAQSASTPAQIATALAEGLAQRGYFSHGVLPGEEPSLSGHGADRLTTLLTGPLMVGDGEQYASAMALMARELGLPSRVVMGFVPPADAAAADEVTITGGDVQAWVEVQFAGHGWVPFDPTPDESRTPRSDEEQQEAGEDPQVRQPPPPLSEPVEPPQPDVQQPATEPPPPPPPPPVDWRWILLVGGAVGLPALLVLGPLVVVAAARRRRRRRRRTAADPVARVVGGWDEVLDAARDLRRVPPASATRRETAVHLAAAFPGRRGPTGAVGTVVAGLAASADAVVFGPGAPHDDHVRLYWRQVDAARAAMRRAVPRRQRLRSRWATASLRHRRRAGRALPAPRSGRGRA